MVPDNGKTMVSIAHGNGIPYSTMARLTAIKYIGITKHGRTWFFYGSIRHFQLSPSLNPILIMVKR